MTRSVTTTPAMNALIAPSLPGLTNCTQSVRPRAALNDHSRLGRPGSTDAASSVRRYDAAATARDPGSGRAQPPAGSVMGHHAEKLRRRMLAERRSPGELEHRGRRPARIRLVGVADLVVLRHARPIAVDVAANIKTRLDRRPGFSRRREQRVGPPGLRGPGLIVQRHVLGNAVAVDVGANPVHMQPAVIGAV